MPVEATAYKSRILCTEDDADNREVLRLLVEMDGFNVTCAENSKQHPATFCAASCGSLIRLHRFSFTQAQQTKQSYGLWRSGILNQACKLRRFGKGSATAY
jgi:hypothetical protein